MDMMKAPHNLRQVFPISEVKQPGEWTPELEAAYPDADPGIYPFGYMVLVQLRRPRLKSDGGIIMPDQVKDADRYRTQTGLVRALGPYCFKRRDTGDDWP